MHLLLLNSCTFLSEFHGCAINIFFFTYLKFTLEFALSHFVLVVDLLDRQEQLPRLFIQMEFCENGTLHSWIEDRNFGKSQKTREDALLVFQQVVRGLKYLHSKELIHRDLKVKTYHLLYTEQKMQHRTTLPI